MITYTLTRSKRKTVAIHIRDGSVEVRAPLRTPKRDIDRFVMSKEQWIAAKLLQSRERAQQREAFRRTCGDAVPAQRAEFMNAAKSHIPLRVAHFAEKMGAAPAAVKINRAKARWGSCSAKKNLNFSWRLMMADDDVIDYVVVHELAHLKEMSHSPRFWAIVEGVLPDYRARQSRLRALQRRLSCEDWG